MLSSTASSSQLAFLRREIVPRIAFFSTNCPLEFNSSKDHAEYLKTHHAPLPQGFSVSTSTFSFTPEEAPHLSSEMTMTLLQPDKPTRNFAAVFTQNAFPGAPVVIGRERLNEPLLGGIIVNNKISNVGAKGGGIQDSENLCDEVAKLIGLPGGNYVLPCSTGVIGWRLPINDMVSHLPNLSHNKQSHSVFPAAKGIMTTDLYPKIRSKQVADGRLVGIAKGAGMIEPNMATMLSFLLTDIAVPREILRDLLCETVETTFNSISVDTDESTSDTVALISSDKVPFQADKHLVLFKDALEEVMSALAQDVARNGEGAHHLMQVCVRGCPSYAIAKGIGKAVVNSPLFKCAVAGNDPNVGRLVMAVGKFLGQINANSNGEKYSLHNCRMKLGGISIFDKGEFLLNEHTEKKLVAHMSDAELIGSKRGGVDTAHPDYPPHERLVEVDIDMGIGSHEAKVIGVDLTQEYVAINADYRS